MADAASVRTSLFGGYGLGSFLAIVIGAVLLLVFTRGRLGYNPERNAQLIEAPRPAETPLANV